MFSFAYFISLCGISGQASNKVIFTGSPGSGKSSVIEKLVLLGYEMMPEAPRQVMEEQKKLEFGKLPNTDFEGFARLCIERAVEHYRDCSAKVTIFDRGIPDIPAYLQYAQFQVGADIEKIIPSHPYNPTVFFFPPWEEIYEKDRIRYESYEQAVSIGIFIKNYYVSLGYELVEVPKIPVDDRADVIVKQMKAHDIG